MNFTHYTLGEALSSPNETIKRNAFSILKQLQKERDKEATKCRHGVFRLQGISPCRECVHNERNKEYTK